MKVAVVGSGVSGLAATWLLNEHSDHEVHLYESDSRPGGHANTVTYHPPGQEESEGIDVDTGFIVCNPATYPNFLRFAALKAPEGPTDPGVKFVPTEMTFSVSRNSGEFEWAGKNPITVFCQPRRFFDPSMWRMLYDVFRFNACAVGILMQPTLVKEISIGDYLTQEKYSDAFRENYLIPMTAAIWSTPPGKCFLDFPAKTFIQFMFNHHLLQILGKPSWLTIQGGSHNYVKKILAKLPKEQLHLNSAIVSASNRPVDESGSPRSKVVLKTADGVEHEFDHVIFACHSDTALQILAAGDITEDERDILGRFEWNKNEVVLHCDPALMPQSRMAWSCWNYLTTSINSTASGSSTVDRISLTYGMNDLQHIPESKYGPVLVTLNPPFHPSPEKTFGWWKYDHPVLDAKAVQAQSEMHKIQNKRGITFAGAYLKYGFHEDGFTSGLLAACAIDEESGKFPTFAPGPKTSGSELSIPVRNKTVRPPFDLQYADHHLTLKRRGVGYVQGFAILIFGLLEASGVRALLGLGGSLVLQVFRILLGIQRL
ncbi:amine oxidase [Ephemerocybe angulata]|uniref:Amine oxidase n=1 Tax=Ephemerocybe angulata TaxID=980116 RepID=A0A8H6LZL5_9AGAR|nr:amine oxidase [Tulosesus angulatus]